jgi:hypothetical protein
MFHVKHEILLGKTTSNLRCDPGARRPQPVARLYMRAALRPQRRTELKVTA